MSDEQVHDPLNFMRNMWGNMGFSLPGMVAPTFDVDELDMGAMLGEQGRDRTTDAPRSPAHDGGPTIEQSVPVLDRWWSRIVRFGHVVASWV